MILGNIYTPRLIVEEGVILDGECVIDVDYKKDSESTASTQISEKSEGISMENSAESNTEALDESNVSSNDSYTAESTDNYNDKQSVGNFNN